MKKALELYEEEKRERKKIPLSPEEKKGLSNEIIFMREYGLYTGFIYDSYWSNKFKENYGYEPELP